MFIFNCRLCFYFLWPFLPEVFSLFYFILFNFFSLLFYFPQICARYSQRSNCCLAAPLAYYLIVPIFHYQFGRVTTPEELLQHFRNSYPTSIAFTNFRQLPIITFFTSHLFFHLLPSSSHVLRTLLLAFSYLFLHFYCPLLEISLHSLSVEERSTMILPPIPVIFDVYFRAHHLGRAHPNCNRSSP